VEISCIGEGKAVDKRTATLTPPKWVVWGGSCSNNTAWFIGVRSTDTEADKVITKN